MVKQAKTDSAGGVVLDDSGRVVVVNQHGRSWSLPKGHVDAGESLEDAARREIEEETGLVDVTPIRALGSYTRYRIGLDGGDDTSEEKTLHFFLYRSLSGALAPQDPDHPEARWVAIDDVAALLTHPKDQAFFKGIIKELKDEFR